MMPPQGQMQVDTQTLIKVLKQDIDMIAAKVMYLEQRRLGIGAAINYLRSRKPGDAGLFNIPGAAEILGSVRTQTAFDLDLAKRQLNVLEERLKRVQSDIIIPGGPNNFPQAS